MAFNINNFRSQLALGGSRASLFQVEITNPANAIADVKVPVMVEAASIPPSTLGTIEQSYFGRKIKLAGNREYPEWTVTVINDEDFLIRNALEQWTNAINTFEGNLRIFGASSPSLYKSVGNITQFSKTGVPLRTYEFNGLWPSSVEAIDNSWDSEEIQKFTVTFQYDYWTVTGGVTGNAGGR